MDITIIEIVQEISQEFVIEFNLYKFYIIDFKSKHIVVNANNLIGNNRNKKKITSCFG